MRCKRRYAIKVLYPLWCAPQYNSYTQCEQRGVFDNETIIHQQQLLETYRRNLRHLLVQAAQYGGEASAPLDVSNNIHRARAHIRQTKTTLRASGVEVADHPND